MLSVARARRLHALVRAAFAARGREVTTGDGFVQDDAGAQFGLYNLAATLAGEPSRRWRGLVDRHVEVLLAAVDGPDPLEGMDLDDVRERLFWRLQDASAVHHRPDHATVLGPDLLAVMTLDSPTSVRSLADADVERLGGIDRLRAVGAANLAALPVEEVARVGAAADVRVLLGDSFYTASRALVLDLLLPSVAGIERPEHGVLVAVPHRHALGVHVPSGPTLLEATTWLAGFAERSYRESPGGISPRLWFVRDGVWAGVSEPGERGPRIVVDGDFRAVVHRLCGPDAVG
jgi:hypothetical protein